MKNLLSLLLLLSLCSVTRAEEPEDAAAPVPKIVGPTERHPGALTFLDASGSSADKFTWHVDTADVVVPTNGGPDVSQTVAMLRVMGFSVDEPKDSTDPLWAISSDRKRLWLSSYPGLYRVTLGVSNKNGVVVLPWKVRVSGDVPIPIPIPVPVPVPIPPNPVPVPPSPAPVALLTQLSVAVQNATTARLEFGRVADAYIGIADQIKSGYLDSPAKVNAFTAVLVTAAATPHQDVWAKIDTDIVKKYVASIPITKVADYEPIWRTIAAAIKAGLVDIPPPPVPPQPDPPAPIPVSELRVLMLFDDTKSIPAAQLGVLGSAPLQVWMTQQGVNWRIWSINGLDTSHEDKGWQDAVPTRIGAGPAWVIVSNGKSGFNGTLPSTVDELKALVTKYKP